MSPTPAFSDAFRSAASRDSGGGGRLDEVERQAAGARWIAREVRVAAGSSSRFSPAPSRRPGVVVGAVAADRHHGVDRGGATEHLAPGKTTRRPSSSTAAPCRSPSRRESDRAENAAGIRMWRRRSVGPASSKSTLVCGFAEAGEHAPLPTRPRRSRRRARGQHTIEAWRSTISPGGVRLSRRCATASSPRSPRGEKVSTTGLYEEPPGGDAGGSRRAEELVVDSAGRGVAVIETTRST